MIAIRHVSGWAGCRQHLQSSTRWNGTPGCHTHPNHLQCGAGILLDNTGMQLDKRCHVLPETELEVEVEPNVPELVGQRSTERLLLAVFSRSRQAENGRFC